MGVVLTPARPRVAAGHRNHQRRWLDQHGPTGGRPGDPGGRSISFAAVALPADPSAPVSAPRAVDEPALTHDRPAPLSDRRWRQYAAVLVLVVVALGFVAVGLVEAWGDSPTFDEPVYVSAGLAAVLHHDLAYNEEHPPLPKVIAVLPVLFSHPVVPANGRWDTNDERTYSARFLRAQQRAGTLRSVTFWSRLLPLLEAVAVAFVLYGLGRDLFGRMAGCLSGLLWLLSPFVLGLGHLDSVDIAFALAVTGWSWSLLCWVRHPSRRATVVLGVVTGAAVLTDVTGLILAALALATVLVCSWRRSRRQALVQGAAVAVIAWGCVWIVYLALDPGVLVHPTVILPLPYLQGIRFLFDNDTIPSPGYLLGVAWTGGRWWYWPGSLVVKSVPTTLALALAGLFGLVTVDRSTRRQAALVLGAPALSIVAFTLFTPRDIGLRYLLPVIALGLVVAGSVVRVARRTRLGTVIVAGAVIIAGWATVASAPDSLAWVSPPFAPAYRAVTNSDIDWGQGYYTLEQWSRGKHPLVAYFGPRGLGGDTISGTRPLLGTDPATVTGWVAASATDLTSAERQPLAWLRAYCPVGDLDGSVLLFHFVQPPTRAAGPTQPVGPCGAATGGTSRRTG